MTDPKSIPHLIKLLDDESSEVQRSIVKELTAFGPILQEELKRQKTIITPTQAEFLNVIFRDQKQLKLRQ